MDRAIVRPSLASHLFSSRISNLRFQTFFLFLNAFSPITIVSSFIKYFKPYARFISTVHTTMCNIRIGEMHVIKVELSISQFVKFTDSSFVDMT